MSGRVQAVRAGDLLFISNLMAVDAKGALAVQPDARSQIEHVLTVADRAHPRGLAVAGVNQDQTYASLTRIRQAISRHGRVARMTTRRGIYICKIVLHDSAVDTASAHARGPQRLPLALR